MITNYPLVVARAYSESGLGSLFPLRANEKFPPPAGVTGQHGCNMEISDWNDLAGHTGNYAIRLNDGVMALDVDNYGAKDGDDTLATLEKKLGKLPLLVCNTRRDPNESGHYFFRYNGGRLRGVAGDSIEIIQHDHRYAVCQPSVIDGAQYRWYCRPSNDAPWGVSQGFVIPKLHLLPELPAKWLKYLSRDVRQDAINVAPAVVEDFMEQVLADNRPMSLDVYDVLASGLADFEAAATGGGSRHDQMLKVLARVTGAAAKGLPNLSECLTELQEAWETHTHGREREFESMKTAAFRLISADYECYQPQTAYVTIEGAFYPFDVVGV